MSTEEVSFPLPQAGITLRGRRSGNGRVSGANTASPADTALSAHTVPPVICLHGWMDNCASFGPLAEAMPEADLVALDLPGHGHSDPIPSLTCQLLDYAICVMELTRIQGWQRYRLAGHSIGGALAAIVAGLDPDSVERLVLLDPVLPRAATAAEAQLSAARYAKAYLKPLEAAPVFATRYQAVKARAQLADVLVDSAERLAARDLDEVPGGFASRSDVRLRYPFIRTLTEDQARAMLGAIAAPTLLITGDQSPVADTLDPALIGDNRDAQHHRLPGGHHVHMENPGQVAAVVTEFLR